MQRDEPTRSGVSPIGRQRRRRDRHGRGLRGAIAPVGVPIAGDDKTARAYATATNSPYRQYYGSLGTKLIKNGRAELFKTSRDMPDSDVTLDYICDKLVIWGSPRKVADEILKFREEVGEFGTLLYAGKDWLDSDLGRRSMILLAEQVMPMVNSALGKGRKAAE